MLFFGPTNKGQPRMKKDSKDRLIKPGSKDLQGILDTNDLQFLDLSIADYSTQPLTSSKC